MKSLPNNCQLGPLTFVSAFALASAATLAAVSLAKPPAPAEPARLQIIAHRGCSAKAPENTLASIRSAFDTGATAVEVDVRLTSDGQLILLHDATLDRTTSGQGQAREHTLQEIRKLDAGSWFAPEFRNEPIPLLSEALEVCRGKIDLMLDLQEQDPFLSAEVVRLVHKHGDPRRTLLGVRSLDQAKWFRAKLPQARQLGLIPSADQIEAFADAGCETIRLWPKWLSDRSLVDRVRKTGAKLHLSGTTGTRAEWEPLWQYRPDSLSSDDPAQLVQTLKELAARESESRR